MFWSPRSSSGARADAYYGLPTPRTTLRAHYVALLVWCKGGCQHQAEADLQKLIDAGRGDVPLIHLRFRCSNCGSDRLPLVPPACRTQQQWQAACVSTHGRACQRPFRGHVPHALATFQRPDCGAWLNHCVGQA
jgi:hypothetical protein